MTPELIERAEIAALLLRAAYKWGLQSYPNLQLLDWCPKEDAILVRLTSGPAPGVWLVMPGSGYGHAARWTMGERASDWLQNIAAQWPIRVPAIGKSGIYRWAWGFLRPSRVVEEWLKDRPVDFACGHSRGAAIVQILAWSAAYRHDPSRVAEAHCVASPRVCFTPAVPANNSIHVWSAPDDFVGSVPWGAVHVGVEHHLPAVNSGGVEDHMIGHYLTRFAMIRQRQAAAARAGVPL